MMFEKLNININRVYPALVVSTMSSGKSTLINALVGRDLLPSRNRACTARAAAILDNDMQPEFKAHVVTKDRTYNLLENVTKSVVTDFNENNDVMEMILEGQIKGIKNSKKALLLIDTPGINNSMDQSHEMVTKEVLDEYPEGLILYVINAQQIGTYDDSVFLELVAKKLRDKDKFNIIFVINKMDLVDPEKESPIELVMNCKEYIESKGVENPVIIPVSANSALILKKVLQGNSLSELEEEEFISCYKRFKNNSLSLVDYAVIPERGAMEEHGEIDGITFTHAELYAALYNTGLTYLENVIDETLVRSLKMKAPRISHQTGRTEKSANKRRVSAKSKKRKNSKK